MSNATNENYSIGELAESRIVAELERLGACGITRSNHNGIPDVEFSLHGLKVYAELKTILSPHGGGRNGVAKMPATEFQAIEALSSDYTKILVVEIRSPHGPGRVCLVVPWSAVRKQFQGEAVAMKSLTFWWVLKNGVPLSKWRPEK